MFLLIFRLSHSFFLFAVLFFIFDDISIYRLKSSSAPTIRVGGKGLLAFSGNSSRSGRPLILNYIFTVIVAVEHKKLKSASSFSQKISIIFAETLLKQKGSGAFYDVLWDFVADVSVCIRLSLLLRLLFLFLQAVR